MTNNPSQTILGLQQKKVFKIIVLGDTSVGKTCLTYRFCEGDFLDKTEATIGVDFRERSVKINNEEIKLQLWDTAGQERFRKSMVQHYYRNVHAVVIVYDITKPETFYSIASWMQEIEAHGLLSTPRVLVGNKCDCGTQESRLATTYAQQLADMYGMPLFETSALLDSECDNVESIFMTLAHKLYSKQPLRVVRAEGEESANRVTLTKSRSRVISGDDHVKLHSDNCSCG